MNEKLNYENVNMFNGDFSGCSSATLSLVHIMMQNYKHNLLPSTLSGAM